MNADLDKITIEDAIKFVAAGAELLINDGHVRLLIYKGKEKTGNDGRQTEDT